jgi:NagD protein
VVRPRTYSFERKVTGKDPSFAGKPNPLMMRTGLNAIGAHSESSAMIGDRMDADVLAGLEAGMRTFLVPDPEERP